MSRYLFALFLSFFGFLSCKKEADSTPPPPVLEEKNPEKELSGNYKGYKFFNKSKKDSLAVTLKVEWLSDKKLSLEEITPFHNVKHLEMNGMEFVFDRGFGEDECGRISMKGTGKFGEGSLYVIETSSCVRGNAPDKFVEYHVTKQ